MYTYVLFRSKIQDGAGEEDETADRLEGSTWSEAEVLIHVFALREQC